ncbi:MAG: SMC-Scp complex subunit ScpB [Candidatus Helarchaeales archaeon]
MKYQDVFKKTRDGWMNLNQDRSITMPETPCVISTVEGSAGARGSSNHASETDGSRRLKSSLSLSIPANDKNALTSESEFLIQLVEACLFIKGEIISEREISTKTGIPIELVHEALLRLSDIYRHRDLAIQVRNIHDDHWIMDLKEIYESRVEGFYIENKRFTKAEIMTLSFIAFKQPVPLKVLSFYRGSKASKHTATWIQEGFVKQVKVNPSDPALADLLKKYEADLIDLKRKSTGQSGVTRSDKTSQANKKGKKPVPVTKKSIDVVCLVTTDKFAGYFNLPLDRDELKNELENVRELQELLEQG